MIPLQTKEFSTVFEGLFAAELHFTQVYQQHQHDHPALREAACLGAQFPAIFLPLREDDWFAGRIRYRSVGFSPQVSMTGGVGYYCHEAEVRRKMDSAPLSDDEREAVESMLAFWRDESTYAKIRRAFSPELAAALPSDEWTQNRDVAFPLYRMAGAILDHDRLVRQGIPGLVKMVQDQRTRAADDGNDTAFFDALLMALETLCHSALFLAEQAQALSQGVTDPQQRARLDQAAQSLRSITTRAPATLHEAIQLVYLYTMHTTLQSNYGRMDVYLGDFYVNDLQSERLSPEDAVEMLLAFWRIMPSYEEFIASARFDTRVIVGGRGRRNEANADAFALAAIEASRRYRGLAPQLSLRFYEGMNPQLYTRALDLLGEGITFPILYNDDVNISAVRQAFDVDDTLAAQYTPFGCGEYVIAHTSFGTPNAVINLAKALEVTLFNGRDAQTHALSGLAMGTLADHTDFDSLLTAYQRQVEYFTAASADFQALAYHAAGEGAAYLFMSLLYDDCLTRGQGMFSGGVRHLGGTFETYGNITAADSLTAIRRCVYQDHNIAPDVLLKALQTDFVGYESERALLLKAAKFGNDQDEADDMARVVHDHICQVTRDQRERTALDSFLVVVINNSANVILGRSVAASADGRRAGEPLTNGNTPTNGMDRSGVTALLNSMVKLAPSSHAGATHNLKFSRSMFTRHRPQLEALLRTYFGQGGSQAMIAVVNRQDLLNALQEPEQYANLIVRVGGFSARFVELPPDVQQDILRRTLWE